eukprot:5786369-Prymnesium_polylepis.1
MAGVPSGADHAILEERSAQIIAIVIVVSHERHPVHPAKHRFPNAGDGRAAVVPPVKARDRPRGAVSASQIAQRASSQDHECRPEGSKRPKSRVWGFGRPSARRCEILGYQLIRR